MEYSTMSLPKIGMSRVKIEGLLPNNLELCVVVVGEADVQNKSITSDSLKKLDQDFGGVISELVSCGDFEGKWLQSSTTLVPNKKSKRLMLLGSGKKTNYWAA